MASLPKRVGTINRLWKEGGAPYQSFPHVCIVRSCLYWDSFALLASSVGYSHEVSTGTDNLCIDV